MHQDQLFKKHYIRSLFYTLALGLCFTVLFYLDYENLYDYFWLFLLFPLYIIFIEIYISRKYYYENFKQLSLPMKNLSKHVSRGLFFHHFLLPILLLFGYAGFVYFTGTYLIEIAFTILILFCYFILLISIIFQLTTIIHKLYF